MIQHGEHCGQRSLVGEVPDFPPNGVSVPTFPQCPDNAGCITGRHLAHKKLVTYLQCTLYKNYLLKVETRNENENKRKWQSRVHHHHTTTISRPFFRDHPGEPVPEENLWSLSCKGRLTEADTLTIRTKICPT